SARVALAHARRPVLRPRGPVPRTPGLGMAPPREPGLARRQRGVPLPFPPGCDRRDRAERRRRLPVRAPPSQRRGRRLGIRAQGRPERVLRVLLPARLRALPPTAVARAPPARRRAPRARPAREADARDLAVRDGPPRPMAPARAVAAVAREDPLARALPRLVRRDPPRPRRQHSLEADGFARAAARERCGRVHDLPRPT